MGCCNSKPKKDKTNDNAPKPKDVDFELKNRVLHKQLSKDQISNLIESHSRFAETQYHKTLKEALSPGKCYEISALENLLVDTLNESINYFKRFFTHGNIGEYVPYEDIIAEEMQMRRRCKEEDNEYRYKNELNSFELCNKIRWEILEDILKQKRSSKQALARYNREAKGIFKERGQKELQDLLEKRKQLKPDQMRKMLKEQALKFRSEKKVEREKSQIDTGDVSARVPEDGKRYEIPHEPNAPKMSSYDSSFDEEAKVEVNKDSVEGKRELKKSLKKSMKRSLKKSLKRESKNRESMKAMDVENLSRDNEGEGVKTEVKENRSMKLKPAELKSQIIVPEKERSMKRRKSSSSESDSISEGNLEKESHIVQDSKLRNRPSIPPASDISSPLIPPLPSSSVSIPSPPPLPSSNSSVPPPPPLPPSNVSIPPPPPLPTTPVPKLKPSSVPKPKSPPSNSKPSSSPGFFLSDLGNHIQRFKEKNKNKPPPPPPPSNPSDKLKEAINLRYQLIHQKTIEPVFLKTGIRKDSNSSSFSSDSDA
jgi:hypothetical protein